MDMELYSILNTFVTIFLGGGWFLHWRASRRKANGEAKQTEAQANKEAQEYYNTTLADVNRTLNEVRSERDHYKEDRNILRQENDEMRKKFKEMDDRLIKHRHDIEELNRRLGMVTPLLCSVIGCKRRRTVDFELLDEAEQNQDGE